MRSSCESKAPILFFDGVCSLCDAFVRFALVLDARQDCLFAPLQGETAQRLIPTRASSLDAVVFLESDGRVFVGVQALAAFFQRQSQPWTRALAVILKALPSPLANALYTLVAKSRYTLFGKKEHCRMPTPKERARFLP